MAAAPSIKHQILSKNLVWLIDPHVIQARLGLLLYAPCAVVLPGESAVEPDLLFISTERRHIVTARACEGPPDLVAEILSPSNSRHDLAVKRELYARHGVPEYWVLEPGAATVLKLTEPVIRRGAAEYTSESRYASGDTLLSDSIPGHTIAVADVFAEPW
jgi:Uma2 family endonuclease